MDGDSAVTTIHNDRAPMTEEILVGKLLSLGSSGKDFNNAVGGFGKAKEIRYSAHRGSSARTGGASPGTSSEGGHR
jgi:hypothetical protein